MKAVDPIVFVAMSFLMIGTGIVASYMPARQAISAPLIFRGYYDQRLSIEIRVLP